MPPHAELQQTPSTQLPLAHCDAVVQGEAAALAQRAGAVEIQIKTERADKVFEEPSGLRIFIESNISATAFGRPGMAL